MTTSNTITKIAIALLAAQKKMGAAKKDAVNPFFKSNYADLGAVMEVCKEPLNENGITILQPVVSDENGTYVETMLLHESGEFLSAQMRLAVKSENNPQDLGSAISYGRRYSLQSLVFVPSEDDDAEKATNHSAAKQTPLVISDHYCELHKIEMKERTSPNGGHYYDHRHKNPDDTWEKCNGTGYKGDMARQTVLPDTQETPQDEQQASPEEEIVLDSIPDNLTPVKTIVDPYKDWSRAKVQLEVMTLKQKGKIETPTKDLNDMGKEELIEILEANK